MYCSSKAGYMFALRQLESKGASFPSRRYEDLRNRLLGQF